MNKIVLVLLLITGVIKCEGQINYNPVDYVNVFTGTSNSRWTMFPGAALPFGMVKLSPDNQANVWNGGYEFTIGSISGFSHLHGMAMSGVSMMPATGSLFASEGWAKTYGGTADGPFKNMWTSGYRSRYDKSTEQGKPGYYKVDLLDYHIKVELTSTPRCGMIRFTYPQNSSSHIIIDFGFQTEELNDICEARIVKLSDTEFSGYTRQFNTYATEHTVYFHIKLNKQVSSMDAWTSEPYSGTDKGYGTLWKQKRSVQKDLNSFTGKGESGAILNFPTGQNEEVIVQTGISFVSEEQAKWNLFKEMIPFNNNFNAVKDSAEAVWSNLLRKITVTTNSENDKIKFYTNLYRSYSGKSIISDVNGKYVDMCEKEQQLTGNAKEIYSGDGFWGAQWNIIPLWTLITPSIANSWVNSFIELSDKGGWIPEAPTVIEYAPIMGAQHHNALIISSYLKGIRNFDVNKAYDAIKHDYITQGISHPCGGYAGNRHLQVYMDRGYVPDEAGPVSNTMEYAYDDWCMSQFAKALGKKDDYKYFFRRSLNYKNVFDTTVKFVRRRHTDGTWVDNFSPFQFGTEGGWNGKGFMESNSWNYSFYAPHQIPELIAMMGRDTFLNRLNRGFSENSFELGNQPGLYIPFLNTYAGKPWLTQKLTRTILRTMFDASPFSGWVGEEDEGQMGAMFVLQSMGLFEMDGGCSENPVYELTTPIFEEIVIDLERSFYKGKQFIIKCLNQSEENDYIQSATLNGKPIYRAWVYHEEIVHGGELVLTLGNVPNTQWAYELPPSKN